MSYRSHRFSYEHLARTLGADGTILYDVAWAEDTADPAAPVSRLYDDQANRLVTADGDGIRLWVCDTNSSTTLPSHVPVINRLILPYPHSLRSDGIATLIEYTVTSGAWTAISTGGGTLRWCGPPGDLVIDFDAEYTARYFRCYFYDGFEAASRVALGEMVWTRVAAPATGVVHSWEHPVADDNLDTTRMLGGETYTTVRGPALRSFSVTHRAVTGDDLILYNDLFRVVGTHTPFWYEHSDSGTPTEVAIAYSESGTWTHTNATGGTATGMDGTASGARTVTASASGFAAVRRELTEYIDVRDAYISIDLMLSVPAAIAAADDLTIQLEDTVTGAAAEWSIGLPIIGSQLTSTWYRVFLDPREEPSSITGSGGMPAVLSQVNRIRVGWQATASTQVMTLDNLIVWHRSAQPVRCRFSRPPERTQDHPVPGSGTPSYTIRMELIEVIG